MTFHTCSKAALFRVMLFVAAALWIPHTALGIELETHESNSYLIHTNLPMDELRPLVEHMDQMHREYTRRFRELVGRQSDREKQNLYLVATNEDYIRLLAEFQIDGSNSGGMFFRGPDHNGLATWVHGRPNRNVVQTLQHEGFHQFASRYIGSDLPVWVNEGLAVYFEQAILVDGRLRIGIAEPHRIEEIRNAISQDNAFGIDSLININSATWRSNMSDRRLSSLQYTQSWSICYFLVHANNGRYQRAFNKYLELVASGRRSDRAFETAFGTDSYEALEQRWIEFVEEDLEADDYSIMLAHLDFLANGVMAIKAAGAELPETFEQYKDLLQRAGFRMQNSQSSAIISAMDDAIYSYEDRRDQSHPFEYVLDAETGLPTISAPAAETPVEIVWVQHGERLTYHLVYD